MGKQSAKMKLLLSMVLAVCLMVTMAQANCGQFGCCFCGSQDGIVIETGSKAPDCNPGYDCSCGYNSHTQTYYGTCAGRKDGDNLAQSSIEIETISPPGQE